MNQIKVKLFSAEIYDETSFEKANENYNFIIEYHKETLSLQNVELTKNTDVVCVFVNDIISQDLILKLYDNGVKMIALRCAGFNNVDISAAEGKIEVVRVPAYSPSSVAEYTLTMMLALNRKINKAYCRTREGNFELHGLVGFNMKGKTVGIIGTGKIGQTLIPILKSLGMIVLAYDPIPDSDFAAKQDYKYVSLDEIYSKSDIISLHCPLNEKNYHLINKDAISEMKKGVMIINTGRGKLIDSKALIDGLKSGKIGFAGLDVYEEETDFFYHDFSDSVIEDDDLARLLSFGNVIVTSHQGYFTKEALKCISETTLENIKLGIIDNLFPNKVITIE